MLRLGTVVLGADHVERAVAFWSIALGYGIVPFPDSDDDFTMLAPPDRVGTRVTLHRSVTPTQERPRVNLDLIVDSPADQSSEIERLIDLGATRVPWDYPRLRQRSWWSRPGEVRHAIAMFEPVEGRQLWTRLRKRSG